MSTVSKQLLSGSTNGQPIKVGATSTPGTLIHTAVSGTSDMDEVWIYATNTSSADVVLTIEYGGATSPDNHIKVSVGSNSDLSLAIPGLIINNSLPIRAYAATGDVINVVGFVNRITAT
ncbi:MAG: hypothetical protein PVI21_03815 [Candidatus Woesebacteria bacterium]|jgi:hypothetical protein